MLKEVASVIGRATPVRPREPRWSCKESLPDLIREWRRVSAASDTHEPVKAKPAAPLKSSFWSSPLLFWERPALALSVQALDEERLHTG